MKNQRGQATVEFAFIAALFMFIVLGMIYGGILFMDYLQYNNDARAIAREVAFMKEDNFDNNGKLSASKTAELAEYYFKHRTDMYTATLAQPKKIDVSADEKNFSIKVQIDFDLNGTWGLTSFIGFPPKKLNSIVYIMPVETRRPN